MTQQELISLRALVDVLLHQAYKARDAHDFGAVNWADLRCTETRSYFTDDGYSGVQAIISEADPQSRLPAYIMDDLIARGYSDVEVIAEW